MLEGKRILITGGAGFIGSQLAERLVAHNSITIFDSLTRNALADTPLLEHPRLRLVPGDVLDADALRVAMRGHDVVFHCAAIAGVDSVRRMPLQALRVAGIGSMNALESALYHSVERIVCFSTSEVFGTHAENVSEEAAASVGPPGEPRWSYAAGKLFEEHLALAYHQEHGLPAVVVRPFNIYGPRQIGEGAVRSFVLRALRDEPLIVRGPGSSIRAWTYVSDMLSAACLAASAPEAVGNHFNVGNPAEPISSTDLALRIVSLSGSSSGVEYADSAEPDIATRVPDIAKARSLLGFVPQVPLDEGLRRTIDWFREHV